MYSYFDKGARDMPKRPRSYLFVFLRCLVLLCIIFWKGGQSIDRILPAKDSCFIEPFQFAAPDTSALNKPCFTMCLSELDYVLCQPVRMRALISSDTCHVNGLSDDIPVQLLFAVPPSSRNIETN